MASAARHFRAIIGKATARASGVWPQVGSKRRAVAETEENDRGQRVRTCGSKVQSTRMPVLNVNVGP